MELHTRSTGSGPPLVLLHGLFGSQENLGSLARGLMQHYTIYAMDLRNHGRSGHAESMTLAELAQDVADTLQVHNLEQTAIIGHSLGGKVAMELALATNAVERIAVLDIAPVRYPRGHNRELDALLALDPGQLASRSAADRALAAHIPEPGIRQFLLKNLVRDGAGFAWRIPLATIATEYDKLLMANTAASFGGPALFLRGGASDYVRDEHEPPIRDRFPNARLETVPAAAHWLHVEQPEAVVHHIKSWLVRAA